jgi:hypothetical protein
MKCAVEMYSGAMIYEGYSESNKQREKKVIIYKKYVYT